MMNRAEERKWVTKLIYQHDFNELTDENIGKFLEDFDIEKSDFVRESLHSIINNIEKIDQIIASKVNSSRFNTMLPIEKAILRVAINEFLIEDKVPVSVSINEAVENAKIFSNDDSYKFINGVLSAIEKEYKWKIQLLSSN